MTKAIPDGYTTITPHLIVPDGARAVEFYRQAFGAEVLEIHRGPDQQAVCFAKLKIGNALVLLAGEFPPRSPGPKIAGAANVCLHLFTPNVDADFQRAVAAGAAIKMPVADMFWGDRYGQVEDPFGHLWAIATHQLDLTPEQVESNARAFFAKQCPPSH